MKQYGVIHKLTGVTVAGPYDGLTQAHSVAKSFGDDFATVTWVGFFGTPAMACVMRQVGDVLVLETACLYKAKAEQPDVILLDMNLPVMDGWTVARTLKRLVRDGLVIQRPYRGVFLTDAGEALATASRERHHIVEAFLIALGVPEDIARRDSEGIEHHVSPETLAIFAEFTRTRGS